MKIEVHSAADFLMNLLRVRQVNSLSESQLITFKGSLQETLLQKFRCHWYPDVPTKGSGYRCIRINGKMDPIIEVAATNCGLNSRQLRKLLPAELTMWIDPEEVSYRIGENGSICVLYDQARRSTSSPSSDLGSTGSEEYTRFEMTPDLNKLVLDFFEKSNTTIVTKPKVHHYNRNRNTNHYNNGHNNNNSTNMHHHQQHFHQQSYNNSSPPLSPHHQQNHYQRQFQNSHFSSPNRGYQPPNYHHQTKVRTQC